jgi:hypothetical protein
VRRAVVAVGVDLDRQHEVAPHGVHRVALDLGLGLRPCDVVVIA